jgi:hypothetical protein
MFGYYAGCAHPAVFMERSFTLMQAEPLLTWSEPVRQFVGFASLFLANGAVGFRFAAVRDRLKARGQSGQVHHVYSTATERAAMLGLIGTLVQGVLLIMQLPELAERMHRSTSQLLTTDPQTMARSILLLTAILGFGLAAARRWSGWRVAAIGLIGRSSPRS